MAHGTYLYLLTVMICEYSPKDHMHMSTKPRLASLYVQHLPHVKNKPTPKDHMHMSIKPRLASLYVQHLAFPTCEETSQSLQDICQKILCTLPHVKKQAVAQRSYAHVYKTQGQGHTLFPHAMGTNKLPCHARVFCLRSRPCLAEPVSH